MAGGAVSSSPSTSSSIASEATSSGSSQSSAIDDSLISIVKSESTTYSVAATNEQTYEQGNKKYFVHFESNKAYFRIAPKKEPKKPNSLKFTLLDEHKSKSNVQQQLVFQILMDSNTPANVKFNYLLSKNLDSSKKKQIISQIADKDIINLFYNEKFSILSAERAKEFVELICGLPTNRLANLVDELIKIYQTETTTALEKVLSHPFYPILTLFISELPPELIAKLYTNIDSELIPYTLWKPDLNHPLI